MWRLLKKIIGSEPAAECEGPALLRRWAALSPTMDGVALAADGRAEISKERAWQRFLVEVTVNVADGTVLTLILNGRPVAPIVIANLAGEFEFATSEDLHLQNELQDVGRIKTLGIATQKGVLVLTGAFRDDRPQ